MKRFNIYVIILLTALIVKANAEIEVRQNAEARRRSEMLRASQALRPRSPEFPAKTEIRWGQAANGLQIRLVIPGTENGEIPVLTPLDPAAQLEVKNVSDRTITLAEQNITGRKTLAYDWLLGLAMEVYHPDNGAKRFFRADDQDGYWSRIQAALSSRAIEPGETAIFRIQLRRLVNNEGVNLWNLRGRYDLQPVLWVQDEASGVWHGQAAGGNIPVIIQDAADGPTDFDIINAVLAVISDKYTTRQIKDIKESGTKVTEIQFQKIGTTPSKSQFGPVMRIIRPDSDTESTTKPEDRQMAAVQSIYDADALRVTLTTGCPKEIEEQITDAILACIEQGTTGGHWGKAIEGATIGIIQAEQVWGRSDWPYPVVRLKLQARNDGQRFLHLPENGLSWHIEVDGDWYEWVDPKLLNPPVREQEYIDTSSGGILRDFNTGDSYSDLTIEVAGNWLKIPAGKEAEYARRRYGSGWVVQNDDYGAMLIFKEGRTYRIRAAIPCPPSRAGYYKTLRPVSNPVEIIIRSFSNAPSDR